jgi:hypothetical protein
MLLAGVACFACSFAAGYYYTSSDPIGKKKFLRGFVIGAAVTIGIAKLVTNSTSE